MIENYLYDVSCIITLLYMTLFFIFCWKINKKKSHILILYKWMWQFYFLDNYWKYLEVEILIDFTFLYVMHNDYYMKWYEHWFLLSRNEVFGKSASQLVMVLLVGFLTYHSLRPEKCGQQRNSAFTDIMKSIF